ncbi:TetR/AcrR family transcriptional regulator [Segnochrobactrum spirostomi]|uniref:TetR/AcrR family transcriptional regulator n=1 Tax=Segnochrobactrum spirostomi TaxID=2608987 RepID=UPI001AD8251D|nr:TetR/AcrR family transcriptional regulator [Segnochrobactrum spirostomi]
MSDLSQVETGLRSRKKAKRRNDIVVAARALFATQGIDATTMADIAAAVGISTPTVFNYFGSKDGILIALINEGTTEARERDRPLHWREGTDLATLIVKMFLRVSARTLEIADKQLWRYAESAAIRHPETEFAQQYASVSEALVGVVAEFFDALDLSLRSGAPTSSPFLARLFHDVWMPLFLRLISEEEHTLDAHEDALRAHMVPLVHMLFDEATVAAPRRKRIR